MRQEIDDLDLEKVAGGTVYISRDKMRVAFSSTGQKYNLVNCTYAQARNLADDLWEANQTLGDAAFDALVRDELAARGWI